MDEQQRLGPHESMEIHEMVNFKTVCLAKSKLMQGLVFDKDLKEFMQKDVELSQRQLTELQTIYKKAPFSIDVNTNVPIH
ncbi:spore gernimation protein GerQ [Paenibacillus xerothermodurans]|uniref:Spore gernimation protein GerQ n=1 Tax=Paenibacillus xerothermodurans TaxID=1977292 RepID=A0A2W1NQS9_PAEXE|nr:spore gernimation protein GerQ [Paenibacillus xerothermodurans]PZE21223.1 spore gernimation protein GerQ [Paenibacillus xerothermodurans]